MELFPISAGPCVIWVDKKINNSENSFYRQELSKIYSNLACYDNIEDGLNKLKKTKFHLTYFITSGSYFKEFCTKLKEIENDILTIPKILIFTSEETKIKIKEKEEINDSFYHFGGLVTSFPLVLDFLNKKIYNIKPPYPEIKKIKVEETDFTFKKLKSPLDLFIPVFLSDIIKLPSKQKFNKFDEYLMDNCEDDKKTMYNLIHQIYNTNCPYSLRIKYWIRAYTLETPFYDNMNAELMQEKAEKYIPFINLLYNCIQKKYLKFSYSKNLYRGHLIKISELDKLNALYKNNIKEFPSDILFCKSFMSFTIDKDVALKFMNDNIPKSYEVRVLYILLNTKELNEKNITFANISDISKYE